MTGYEESQRIFKIHRLKEDHYTQCLWSHHIKIPDCIIECWQSTRFGIVFVQIWPDGNGFTDYIPHDLGKVYYSKK